MLLLACPSGAERATQGLPHNAASLVSNSAPLETFLGPPPEAQAQADVPLAPTPKQCGVREHKTEERRGKKLW